MTVKPTRAETAAVVDALAAFEACDGDLAVKLLEAGRAFRDSMPPRRAKLADAPPDVVAAGRAARRVLDAVDAGRIKQPMREIYLIAGRAAIEAAIPSLRARQSKGPANHRAAGKAANSAYWRLNRSPANLSEVEMNTAIGKAAMKAAWLRRKNEAAGDDEVEARETEETSA